MSNYKIGDVVEYLLDGVGESVWYLMGEHIISKV